MKISEKAKMWVWALAITAGLVTMGGTLGYLENARIKKALVKPAEMTAVEPNATDSERVERVFEQISSIKYNEDYKFIVNLIKEHSVEEIHGSIDLEPEIKKVLSVANKDYETVIKELKTPLEAAVYSRMVIENVYEADQSIYGKKDYFASFKRIHKEKGDDCDGGALATAAILSDDGYQPYLAVMDKKDSRIGHVIFVYKTNDGKYGSVGISKSDFQTSHNSMEELLEKINKESGKEYEKMKFYDLSKRFTDFIDNDKNNNPTRP